MHKQLRVSTMGVADDYHQSLVPRIIEYLGYSINWTPPNNADLIIYGPFFEKNRTNRWIPKPVRRFFRGREYPEKFHPQQVTIFQTGENIRHNTIPADYSLSFDLAVDSLKHLRLPYWMEQTNWDHEGIFGIKNPRFGRPIELKRLSQPLGSKFLKKPKAAVLFASHLNEPRSTLYKNLSKVLPTKGVGPYFDQSIEHHNSSGFRKCDVMKNFAFNLCPENSMYPGYYTEKIPEAFMGDCLPLTWVDENVAIDFNPLAFINLAPMMHRDFENLKEVLNSRIMLEQISSQPLLHVIPSLAPHIAFVHEIVRVAAS